MFAGDGLHCFLQLGDVLDVDGADYFHAGGQQILDILPPSWIPGTRGIVIGKPIDHANARTAIEESVHVDLDPFFMGTISDVAEQCRDLGGDLRLDCADHDVLTALAPAPRLVEHAKRLADAGRVTEEYLEIALPDSVFLGLSLAQKFFGSPASGSPFRSPGKGGTLFMSDKSSNPQQSCFDHRTVDAALAQNRNPASTVPRGWFRSMPAGPNA